MAHTCVPSSWELEAEGSGVCHTWLHKLNWAVEILSENSLRTNQPGPVRSRLQNQAWEVSELVPPEHIWEDWDLKINNTISG